MNINKVTFPVIVLAVIIAYTLFLRTDNIYVKLPYVMGGSFKQQITDIYQLETELSKDQTKVNTYLPKYMETGEPIAKMYAGFFNMNRNAVEKGDYYLFTSSRGSLYVYKHTNLIRYEIAPNYYYDDESRFIFTDTEALNHATDFIEDNFLYLNYEKADIAHENGIYTVTLINRIGNLKNYAFPNEVTLDECGNILSLDYYFITYEKLNDTKIRSMQDAFYLLPVDFSDEIAITIEDCSLVYVYKNSIVQPSYYFTGTISDSSLFECFINASAY